MNPSAIRRHFDLRGRREKIVIITGKKTTSFHTLVICLVLVVTIEAAGGSRGDLEVGAAGGDTRCGPTQGWEGEGRGKLRLATARRLITSRLLKP